MSVETFERFVEVELDRKAARATLRAREQETGRPVDEMGAYWLRRTAALEHVAEAARQGLRNGDWTELYSSLEHLDTLPAPLARIGDHQC